MTKRIARALATSVLAAGIVAVPAAGSAFASSHSSRGGSEQFYNHQVQASAGHVHYSESTTYYSSSDCDEYGNGGYGHGGLGNSYGHNNGYYGGGILGLGLLGL